MRRVGRAAIAVRVLHLAIVVLRVAIGLPAMVNAVRTRLVAMRRVGRAAIAVRVRRLAIVVLRAVIGLPAMVNAARSRRAVTLRVVRAASAAPVLPSATAAPHVATAPPATPNAVRSSPAMIRVARAAIERPDLRSMTAVTVAPRASATTRTMAARVQLPPTVNDPRATALT
jgi:hypothetical protein